MHVPRLTTTFLDRAVEYYDDCVGVIADDGTEYTYREFADRVNRLSHALADMGVEKGDRVATLSPNTHWDLEALFATQQLGAVFTPFNYRLVPDDYEYLLTDSGADVLLADYAFAENAEPVLDSVSTDHFVCYEADRADDARWRDYEELLADYPTHRPARPEMDEDDIAAINYTSGTTGDPKGVVRTHRTDVWNAVTHCHNMDIRDDDVYLWTLPMFHVHGWGNMYTITAMGGVHVCLREFTPERAFEKIRDHDVSYLCGAPTVLNMMREHYDENPDIETTGDNDVRLAMAGAAPPKATIEAVQEDLGWELNHFYGHTESGPCTTSTSPRRIAEQGEMQIKPTQGIPSLGLEMDVVDENGESVPWDGETIGEIVLRGDHIMDHYWNKPEETERAFNARREGWFHSGDLATRDSNGMISIKDRKKDIIVSGGENISSIEIEDAIYDHEAVVRAAVIPVPSQKWGETPKAFVVLKEDADLTEADLVEFVKERIASYKAPTQVEFVDQLPTTATGKVQKYELRQQEWKHEDRLVGEG